MYVHRSTCTCRLLLILILSTLFFSQNCEREHLSFMTTVDASKELPKAALDARQWRMQVIHGVSDFFTT